MNLLVKKSTLVLTITLLALQSLKAQNNVTAISILDAYKLALQNNELIK